MEDSNLSVYYALSRLTTTTFGSSIWFYPASPFFSALSVIHNTNELMVDVATRLMHAIFWWFCACQSHLMVGATDPSIWINRRPPVSFQKVLFLLLSALGRWSKVLLKKGNPTCFPLLYVKYFFQLLSFMYLSMGLDSATFDHVICSALGLILSIKRSQFLWVIWSANLFQIICAPTFSEGHAQINKDKMRNINTERALEWPLKAL